MSRSTEAREPFDAPKGIRERRKRDKAPKERIHVYLTTDSLQRVDEKADELGLDRSPCLQILINYGLSQNIKLGQPAPSSKLAPRSAGKSAGKIKKK